MRILVKVHYLCPYRTEIEVPAEEISAYYKAADPSLNLEFVSPAVHKGADGQSADFFDTQATAETYCANISRITQTTVSSGVPTIHMLISNGAPKLFGSFPDGAILNRQRTAIAVFLGTRNFTRTYRNNVPRYPDLWNTFYLQVCVHEIGHALTWTHGIESKRKIRHIMLQSKHRIVDKFSEPWTKAKYSQPRFKQALIKCHPLPDPALEDLKRPESVWAPGHGSPFSKETLCA